MRRFSVESYLQLHARSFQAVIPQKRPDLKLDPHRYFLLPSAMNPNAPASSLIAFIPKELWTNIICTYLSKRDMKNLRLSCRWLRAELIAFPMWKQWVTLDSLKDYFAKCKRFFWTCDLFGVYAESTAFFTRQIFQGVSPETFRELAIPWSSNMGENDIILWLLQQFPKLRISIRSGLPNATILHWACVYNQPEVVRLLLKRGEDPHACYGTTGDSPLHLAASKGYTEIVEALLQYNANPWSINYSGNTALEHAAFFGHKKILLLFLNFEPSQEIAKKSLSIARDPETRSILTQYTALQDVKNKQKRS